MNDNLPQSGNNSNSPLADKPTQGTTTVADTRTVAGDDQQIKKPVSQPVSAPTEDKEAGGRMFKEAGPINIEKKEFAVPKEVKDFVKEEKKEEITLPQPVKDDYGQVLIDSAMPPKPKIVLPLSKDQTNLALKKKIIESARWLAVWCLRLIKMFPKRAVYKVNS
ncbi:hypothetical protein ACFLZ1_00180 [Patescibacteria group bacterium]